MKRDHRLGFPAALLADTPAENTARYPLGRPTRDPETAPVWPFPLVKPAVTFVAYSRTMDSDRPQPVVLGVDMGKPGGDETVITLRRGNEITFFSSSGGPATNIEPGCFGVWRKTPPQPNVELKFRSPWTGEIKSRWPGPQSGWADGWEWFDTTAAPEKPAQAEPQATPQPDADGWIEHDGKGMPIHGTTMIETRLRRGTIHKDRAALWHDEDPKYSNWVHEPCQLDIVAYRVVSA